MRHVDKDRTIFTACLMWLRGRVGHARALVWLFCSEGTWRQSLQSKHMPPCSPSFPHIPLAEANSLSIAHMHARLWGRVGAAGQESPRSLPPSPLASKRHHRTKEPSRTHHATHPIIINHRSHRPVTQPAPLQTSALAAFSRGVCVWTKETAPPSSRPP